jgi:uncharacterized protein (TIGR00369 family)
VAEGARGDTPPQGFVRMEKRGAFSTHNGPYYVRQVEAGRAEQAFYAAPIHENGIGLVHGGMLAAFMDGVLASSIRSGTGKTAVTMHMSIDFLQMTRVGEWVQGEARMTRATNDVAFAEGRAFVGDRDVVRLSGVFKLMARR